MLRTNHFLIPVLMLVFYSCEQNPKSAPESSQAPQNLAPLKLNLVDSISSPNPAHFLDTQLEYSDSMGNSLLIQNSLPKEGQKYRDSEDNEFTYAVFWSQITNNTEQRIDLTINFPKAPQQFFDSLDLNFRLILPPVSMSTSKKSELNYGLSNIDLILDNSLKQAPSLKKEIEPNQSEMFYIIVLTNQGLDGTIRAGFSLDNQELFFRLNQKEISAGSVLLNPVDQ